MNRYADIYKVRCPELPAPIPPQAIEKILPGMRLTECITTAACTRYILESLVPGTIRWNRLHTPNARNKELGEFLGGTVTKHQHGNQVIIDVAKSSPYELNYADVIDDIYVKTATTNP